MSSTVISVENLSKVYRLGQIGTGTLSNDLKVWWARARGKPNPLLKIGQTDYGNVQGENLWALRDVSFKVEQGEVLGIIGRNGAGKSTLLKILSRVTAPTSGVVKVKGRIASLLEVGTGFHPELTGRENIYLNGAILGMTREEVRRKFDEIVDFAGVEDFIDTPVKRYSSGMYVRLAFAVAAHLESEILLVDEVLAVGDAEFQKKSLGKMGDVASKEGRTVLFVSHNMGAVRILCQKGILLKQGSSRTFENINDCIDNYLITNRNTGSEVMLQIKDNIPICLTSIKINSENGLSKNKFSFDEPIVITINIHVNQLVSRIYFALHIIDNEQQTILFSRNFENNLLELSRNWMPGDYEYQIRIPKNLLVPGMYNLKLHLATSLPAKIIDGIENTCFFEVLDTGSTRSLTGFPWSGKVAFFPEWTLKQIDHS